MAQFTVNATRFDPYKAFMFRVKWDGKYVAGPVEDERAEALDRSRHCTARAAIPRTSARARARRSSTR